jgi:hypothetical protein
MGGVMHADWHPCDQSNQSNNDTTIKDCFSVPQSRVPVSLFLQLVLVLFMGAKDCQSSGSSGIVK